MKSPDCYITTTQVCYKEDSHYRGQAFRLNINKKYYYGDVFSGWVDLAYDNVLLCSTCSTFLSFSFWFSAVFYYISIYIAIETSKFSIFIVAILGLSNLYKCLSASVGYFYSSSIIMPAFCRLVSLFY